MTPDGNVILNDEQKLLHDKIWESYRAQEKMLTRKLLKQFKDSYPDIDTTHLFREDRIKTGEYGFTFQEMYYLREKYKSEQNDFYNLNKYENE
jgi:hypothetical protein